MPPLLVTSVNESLSPAVGQALVPLSVNVAVPQIDQTAKEQRSRLMRDAKSLGMTGWGKDGDIAGFYEEIPIAQCWANPLWEQKYLQETIDEMAASIAEHGQLHPIIVIDLPDPRPPKPGHKARRYMVVKGGLRKVAKGNNGDQTINAIVKPYRGMVDAMTQYINAKNHVNPVTPLWRVQLIVRLMMVYEQETELFRSQGLPHPTQQRFYTQAQLGIMFGKSQGTISDELRVLKMPEEFQALADTGKLPYSVLMELMRGDDDMSRMDRMHRYIAEIDAGNTVPKMDARADAAAALPPPAADRSRGKGKASARTGTADPATAEPPPAPIPSFAPPSAAPYEPSPDVAVPPPQPMRFTYGELALPKVGSSASQLIITAAVFADVIRVTEALTASYAEAAPLSDDVRDLYALISRPTFRNFVAENLPSALRRSQ